MKELDNKKGGETKKPKNMEKIIEQAFHHFSDACVELAGKCKANKVTLVYRVRAGILHAGKMLHAHDRL